MMRSHGTTRRGLFIVALSVMCSTTLYGQNALSLTAIPATISFNANNPGSNIAGSSAATVTFSMSTRNNLTWTLNVATTAATFTGCATVPTSAVSLKCSSATISGGAHGATAACSVTSFTPLPSTTPGLQVATGLEPNGGTGIPFTITLNYQLADSWKYIAQTCPLTLTYTVIAP